MSVENFNQAEYEQRVTTYAPFLGGVLEVDGSARLKIDTHHYTVSSGETRACVRAYPIIEITDNDHSHTKNLVDLFGGNTTKKPLARNSTRWTVKYTRAYIIADAVYRYAPSRREFSDACVNLKHADDVEEKVRIAQELIEWNKNRFRGLSDKDYVNLIKNPLFISGVLAGRCSPTYRHEITKEPNFVINSENINLLKTLQARFGGHIPSLEDAPQEAIDIGLYPIYLKFDQPESRNLHQFVDDFFAKNASQYPELLAA